MASGGHMAAVVSRTVIRLALRVRREDAEVALAELLETVPAGVADVGCGSGVLGIAAAKLGWAPVLGLDHDVAAVAATRENAGANGVRLDVRRWDLRTDPLPDAPVVVANLVRPLLLTLAERMADP